MNWRQLPNALTVARGLLAAPLAAAILGERYDWALAVMVIAGLSDALDGFLAVRYGWESRLGAVLDPIADKLLMSTAMACLWLVLALPLWLLVLVLARDVVIMLGSLAWWLRFGPFTPEPSVAGKFTTLMQVVLVLGLLADRAGLGLSLELRLAGIAATALFTVASGLDYVFRFGLRAWQRSRSSS